MVDNMKTSLSLLLLSLGDTCRSLSCFERSLMDVGVLKTLSMVLEEGDSISFVSTSSPAFFCSTSSPNWKLHARFFRGPLVVLCIFKRGLVEDRWVYRTR